MRLQVFSYWFTFTLHMLHKLMAKTVNARYKAPDELNCSEPFENAQIIAKQETKWLLINIQQGDDFSSHTLNHTFNDEMMQEINAGC